MALNPQQQMFKEAYCNPESETFGNALQSALRAGYTKEYAEVMMARGNDWMSDLIRGVEMAQESEKVLLEMLRLPIEDASFAKIKQDTAKFISERIGRFGQKSQVNLTSEGKKIEANSPEVLAAIKSLEETLKKEIINNE